MTNNLIYVYCLADRLPDLTCITEFTGLRPIESGGVFAIMKDVYESEFSEENFKKNLSDFQWLETNARQHVEVINKISEQHTAIPFKFGTIFKTEDSLKKFITDYSDSLAENFKNIEGKEEWSVKIYSDRNALSEQIDELSAEAAELEKQIMASSPGKAYLLRRKKTDLIEQEINRICETYGQQYYDECTKHSESTNLNNLLPKEFTGREDTMILNATFLVKKNLVADFKNTVKTLSERDGNYGFFIESTGPWPPFSFIVIKEKQK